MFLETPTPDNPTLNYIIASAISLILGFISSYLLKKNDNSKDIEIAKINSKEKEVEALKKDLETALVNIRELEEEIRNFKTENKKLTDSGFDKDRIIYQLEEILKRFKLLFDVTYKQLKVVLRDNEDGLVVLEEVKKTFDDHN